MEEEHNTIPDKVKIRKIGVVNKIDKEKCDSIFELFRNPWSWNGVEFSRL